jgi:hypothetical protein
MLIIEGLASSIYIIVPTRGALGQALASVMFGLIKLTSPVLLLSPMLDPDLHWLGKWYVAWILQFCYGYLIAILIIAGKRIVRRA